ncbi:MAG: endonuclease domain-containing protein, partial [Nevskiales bacterium]
MSNKRFRISPDRTAIARRLRRDSTFPERLLWSRIRGSQLAGLKFRRQQVLMGFVVDFYCPDAMLVVEIDGQSHLGRGLD